MRKDNFNELTIDEIVNIDGGAIVGAAIGYIAGNYVGAAAGAYALYDSIKSGSSGKDAGKALLTVWGASVVSGTAIGAVFGP